MKREDILDWIKYYFPFRIISRYHYQTLTADHHYYLKYREMNMMLLQRIGVLEKRIKEDRQLRIATRRLQNNKEVDNG